MSKIRVGNKQNSFLNGLWGGHARKWGKRLASGIRRSESKKVIRADFKDAYNPTSINSLFI